MPEDIVRCRWPVRQGHADQHCLLHEGEYDAGERRCVRKTFAALEVVREGLW